MDRSRSERSFQKPVFYELFSDFEGTLVLPEIPYKDWALEKVTEKAKFLHEYETRLSRARAERTVQAWVDYLTLYAKVFNVSDFKEISSKYSINNIFLSWYKRFLKAYNYEHVELTIVTRGFAPVVRNYLERSDVKLSLNGLKIQPVKVIGSEPQFDKQGVMKALLSAVYSKRKFVKDGHIMLGDESEEKEFADYAYFVNLSKWKGRE